MEISARSLCACLYCFDSTMTLAAIITPPCDGEKLELRDIVTVDLQFTQNRVANMIHLINLAPLLSQLASLVSSPVDDEKLLMGPVGDEGAGLLM